MLPKPAYIVQYYTVQCTLYTVYYTLYIVYCTLCIVHCTSLHCTLYNVQYRLYRTAMYSVYSINRASFRQYCLFMIFRCLHVNRLPSTIIHYLQYPTYCSRHTTDDIRLTIYYILQTIYDSRYTTYDMRHNVDHLRLYYQLDFSVMCYLCNSLR